VDNPSRSDSLPLFFFFGSAGITSWPWVCHANPLASLCSSSSVPQLFLACYSLISAMEVSLVLDPAELGTVT
jgi:hypothetical protein